MVSESKPVAWKGGWVWRGVGLTTENRKLSRGDRGAHHLGCGDSFTGIYICQNIKLCTLKIVCQLYLIEGDISELYKLGELLTFPSVIFLITERTVNHTEDGGEARGRPTA